MEKVLSIQAISIIQMEEKCKSERKIPCFYIGIAQKMIAKNRILCYNVQQKEEASRLSLYAG